MANKDRTAGLIPVKHLNGNPWNGQARMYYIAVGNTPAIFIGDPVVSAGSSDSTGKYASINQAAVDEPIRGVVVGFSDQPYMAFDTTDLDRKYCPASKAMYALVVDDPDVIFEIQEDSDANNNIDADMIGLNADITVDTTGDTNSGISGVELDSSDAKSGTAQLRILGVVDREDNALGTNCKFHVLINEHELRSVNGAGV